MRELKIETMPDGLTDEECKQMRELSLDNQTRAIELGILDMQFLKSWLQGRREMEAELTLRLGRRALR